MVVISQADYSKIDILEDQIRECYGRVVWSHKTQEKCADILNKRNSCFRIIQIIVSSIITSGIIAAIIGDKYIFGIITAIVSAIQLVFNSYLKNYDLGEIAQKHSSCAVQLWNIRENYLSLLTDIRMKILSIDDIVKKRDDLQRDLNNIYKGAPRSISAAYNEASKALKAMEEMTFSVEEIDSYLPKSLKKNSY